MREATQEGEEGLFIPSFLEEALGGDGNLQIKMTHTMQAQRSVIGSAHLQSTDISSETIIKEKWDRAPTAEGASPK